MDRFERLLRVRRDDAAYSIARADDTDREFLAEKQAKSGPEHERAPAYDYLTTATTPVATETYADGMGRILSAANGVRLNLHLINSGSDPKDAYVVFKVTYVDPPGSRRRSHPSSWINSG
jgi:hypothetical protein